MEKRKRILKGGLIAAVALIAVFLIQNGTCIKAKDMFTEYVDIRVYSLWGEEKMTFKVKPKYRDTITSINIPASVVYNGKEYPILAVSSDAFEDCTALTEVFIPEGVTKIEHSAFFRCKNLQTIHFPSTVKIIAKNAFDNTQWLTTNRMRTLWL